jgi:hypothetical protein
MIRIGDLEKPPRRQLLGSDAYHLVHEALAARLKSVTTQREIAFSTDRDGFTPPPN